MEAAGRRWILYPSRSDVFTIWNLADLHIGNRAVALERLKADVQRIKSDPRSFWWGGGDYAEYISPSDKRFDPRTFPDDMPVAELGRLGMYLTKSVRGLLLPIKRKCLGLLFGNHEYRYAVAKEQYDLHGWLCGELEVPNLGYSCYADLMFVRHAPVRIAKLMWHEPHISGTCYRVRHYLFHGAGAAQTSGGKMNRLVKSMQDYEDADVVMIAHCHDQFGKRLQPVTADDRCEKLTHRDRVGVCTGTYLRTAAQHVTTYAEIRGMSPVPLGARFVRITPDKREITAEI